MHDNKPIATGWVIVDPDGIIRMPLLGISPQQAWDMWIEKSTDHKTKDHYRKLGYKAVYLEIIPTN